MHDMDTDLHAVDENVRGRGIFSSDADGPTMTERNGDQPRASIPALVRREDSSESRHDHSGPLRDERSDLQDEHSD